MAEDKFLPSFKSSIDEINQLNKEVKEGYADLLKMADAAVQLNKSFRSIPNKSIPKFPNDAEKAISGLSNSLEKIKPTQKAYIQALQNLAKSESNLAFETAKVREETNKNNKANKEAAQAALGLLTPYQKLSKTLTDLRNNAKNLGAQIIVGKQQGKDVSDLERKFDGLQKEVLETDSALKKLDHSLGQNNRTVGDYRGQLGDLFPELGRLERGLSNIGVELTDLNSKGGKSNPFQALTTGIVNFGKATLSFLLSPVGLAITAIGGLVAIFRSAAPIVAKFDEQLISVGKTTGLSGDSLRSLGDEIVKLSQDLGVISTEKLLDIAGVAGQLGLKSKKDILDFTETLAKLETATNIQGEEGAQAIAQLLNVIEGGTQNVKAFGDEITNLGNNSATTEKAILEQATVIGQATAQYDIGRKNVLAYSAATASIGLNPALTGSVIGKVLREIDAAVVTGSESLGTFSKIIGVSGEELQKSFAKDKGAVLTDFIEGLNRIAKEGGSVSQALESVGLKGDEVNKVIPILATKGFDILSKSMITVGSSAGVLDQEFTAASGSLVNQLARIKVAWENLVLTIEDGQGVFSQVAGFFVGIFADAITSIALTLQNLKLSFDDLTRSISYLLPEGGELGKTFSDISKKALELFKATGLVSKDTKSLTQAFFQMLNPLNHIRVAIDFLARSFSVTLPNAMNYVKIAIVTGKNILENFALSLPRIGKLISDFAKDIANPFNGVDFSGFKKGVSGVINDLGKLSSADELQVKVLERANNRRATVYEAEKNRRKKEAAAAGEAAKREREALELSNYNTPNGGKVLPNKKSNINKTIPNQTKEEAKLSEKLQEDLDFFITFEKAKQATIEQTELFYEKILEKRVAIARQKAKEQGDSEKALSVELAKIAEETNKDKEEEIKRLKDIEIDLAEDAYEAYKLLNDAQLNDKLLLSEQLLEIEKNRLEEERRLGEEFLKKKYDVDEETIQSKIDNNIALTDAERDYLKESRKLNEEYNNELKELNSKSLDEFLDGLNKVNEDVSSKFQIPLALQAIVGDSDITNEKIKEFQENIEAINEQLNAVREQQKEAEGGLSNVLLEQEEKLLEARKKQTDQLKEQQELEITNRAISAISAIEDVEDIKGVLKGLLKELQLLAVKNILLYVKGPLAIPAAIAASFAIKALGNKIIGAFEEGTDNAPATGMAIVDEAGAEIHTDSSGMIKSLGSNKGARFTKINRGDKIIPHKISEMIKSSNNIRPNASYINNAMLSNDKGFDEYKITRAITTGISKVTSKQSSFVVYGDKIIGIDVTDKSKRAYIFDDIKESKRTSRQVLK